MLRAFAAYTVVFILMALPWIRIATHGVPDGAVMASYHDNRLIVWVLAWVAHALAIDPTGVYDANIFYPAPAQLTGSEHFFSSQLVFAPVFWITDNAVLSANVVAMVSYPLAALTMERLLVALGVGAGAAWVGGLVFALGPFQIPGNLHVLQYVILFFPLVALALTRLRRHPAGGNALGLVVACTLGFLSSYYMVVMLAVAAAAWGVMELVRPGEGRLRFLALALGAGVVALLLVGWASIPYLQRPDTVPQVFLEESCRTAGYNRVAAFAFLSMAGPVAGVLGVLGLVVLLTTAPTAAAVARRGAIVLLLALVFMLGPAQCIGEVKFPMPFAALLASPAKFFRYPWRFTVLAGFGIALLAAASLDALRRRLGPRLGRVLVAVAAALVLVDRGMKLGGTGVEEIRGQTTKIYGLLAEATRGYPGGSLLELPLYDVREKETPPDSMVGSTRHWLPLVVGYTGYEPPHQSLVMTRISALPGQEALGELVDLTAVRWLLLRPEEAWRLPAQRERLLELPGLQRVLEVDGWVLLRVERVPEHPEWFAALAEGPKPGFTLLGTPLVLLPEWGAVAHVQVTKASLAYAGHKVGLALRVRNAGTAPWPVAVPPGASEKRTVQLVSQWTAVDSPGAELLPPQLTPLPRDMAPGELLRQPVYLDVPEAPGLYDVDIAIRQVDGNRFDDLRNAPVKIRLRVLPAEQAPRRPEKEPMGPPSPAPPAPD